MSDLTIADFWGINDVAPDMNDGMGTSLVLIRSEKGKDVFEKISSSMKLKEVFQLNDINELPIVYNIAWYEQKAVIVLLALLSLGVKDIHLGPTLPAFLSPNVVKVLVDMFHIAGIGSVEDDLKKFGL